MAEILFFVAGTGAIAGAIGVIALRNAFYSVLALVGHLISLAALFLLLRAEFVAAAQVVVYAGAVMVLYVFVVSYVGQADETLGPAGSSGGALRLGAVLFAGALLAELCIAVLGSGLKALDTRGAGYVAGFGSPGQIGDLLLTRFLAPFEIASFLLLIAAVGAVVLARRRGGLPDEGETVSAARFFLRPADLGTMAEGVGSAISGRALRVRAPTGPGGQARQAMPAPDPGRPAEPEPEPPTSEGGW
ncbi:MAG TPA: NADH-quinone oxidoreductase subunit J [Solirubrobacteraceae bacterium]|nr:NADH-quinone oxidoreductase subunit J [Solirubrobacteraceae bacterium]